MLPFQQGQGPFGQNNGQQSNLFGMPSGGVPNAANQMGTAFEQPSKFTFGTQNLNPLQNKPVSPFNQAPTFGGSLTEGNAGINNTGIVQQPVSHGISSSSLFGQPAQSMQFGAPAAANAPPQTGLSTASPGTTAEEAKAQTAPGSDPATGNHSNLISSIKENSVNLYNLTLQEILDRHTMILESNIREFEKDAEKIFERDLQLIRNKNNFISIQNKITEENTKLDELDEALDFFEKQLEEVELGDRSEMGRVIEDFEYICDKFYKKVESFKDEQDEVLDLVNENYEIIDSIDKKLEYLVKLRNIK